MRLLVAVALCVLTGCGRSEQDELNDFNQHMAEANALLAPDMPRGWHYTVRPDRIRNTVNRMATLPSEDEDDINRDQTLILGIGQHGDERVDVFFRGHNNMLKCYTTCGVYYRAGDRTGSWVAERGEMGNDIILSYPEEALPIIRSATSLIVEVPGDVGGQQTFKPAGLTWPPKASSR